MHTTQSIPILQSIQDLLPMISARRQDIETARQLPAGLADLLRQTRVWSLGIPKTLGGEEAAPADIMRVIEMVAAADGSVGWCTMIGIGNNMSSGYINEHGAKEVWADPTLPTAGIAAPAGAAVRGEGGVRVTGRWMFASGITHCKWLWAGCLVMENGQPRMTPQGPEIIHVCMPVADVVIHDTWHVSGLCGTGSHDFSANDVFVPEHRIFALLDPSGHRPTPLYQMPPIQLFVSQVVCVSLGIARSALDELYQLAQTKTPTMYQTVAADRPVMQVELARAEAALSGARSFLYETVEDMWATVRAGHTCTSRQLALSRIACTNAAEVGAEVTRTASQLAGGSSIYLKSSLQRHARDADAVTHHFTVAPHTWEEAGRVLLGRQPTTPVF